MPNTLSNNVKHNKKKNIGIIFELLASHLAKAILEEDDQSSKKIAGLLKKYYGSKTPIKTVYQYYDHILETKCKNESNTRKIIETIIEHYHSKILSKPNMQTTLEESRKNLLREINEIIGSKFWERKIHVDTYKALASIFKLLNYDSIHENLSLQASIDLTNSKSFIIEHLTQHTQNDIEKERQEYNQLMEHNDVLPETVIAYYYKHFNDQYNKDLNENQKKILTYYYSFVNHKNIDKYTKNINEHKQDLKKRLMKTRKYIGTIEDSSMQKQYLEAVEKYDEEIMAPSNVIVVDNADNVAYQLMLYEELYHEAICATKKNNKENI